MKRLRVIPLTARGTMDWDYSRAGQRWDAAELAKLRKGREDGYTIRELAIAHKRTGAGIIAALEAIGAIPAGLYIEAAGQDSCDPCATGTGTAREA